MKQTLIIDIPAYFDNPYLLQEKVFEFAKTRRIYVKDYKILYRYDTSNSYQIEKLIRNWDLDSEVFTVNSDSSNISKISSIKRMVSTGSMGDALIFFNAKKKDTGNKIVLDFCSREHNIYTGVCRLDFNNNIF